MILVRIILILWVLSHFTFIIHVYRLLNEHLSFLFENVLILYEWLLVFDVVDGLNMFHTITLFRKMLIAILDWTSKQRLFLIRRQMFKNMNLKTALSSIDFWTYMTYMYSSSITPVLLLRLHLTRMFILIKLGFLSESRWLSLLRLIIYGKWNFYD